MSSPQRSPVIGRCFSETAFLTQSEWFLKPGAAQANLQHSAIVTKSFSLRFPAGRMCIWPSFCLRSARDTYGRRLLPCYPHFFNFLAGCLHWHPCSSWCPTISQSAMPYGKFEGPIVSSGRLTAAPASAAGDAGDAGGGGSGGAQETSVLHV